MTSRLLRYLLGVLLAFAALNAFGGGYYGMSGAEGVPVEWLTGTPFTSYFIPCLILFVVVGVPFLFAAVAMFANWKIASRASYLSIIIVMIWLLAEMLMIGYVSWMQPVTAAVALVILALTRGLNRSRLTP